MSLRFCLGKFQGKVGHSTGRAVFFGLDCGLRYVEGVCQFRYPEDGLGLEEVVHGVIQHAVDVIFQFGELFSFYV